MPAPAAGPGGEARRARGALALRRLLGWLTGLALFFMMAVTTVDVVARFAFSSPLPGTFELMEFGLAVVVFTALPLVTWDRGHITVTLFEGLFRGAARRIQQTVVMAASALGMAVIAVRMWDQGDRLHETGATTGFLLWPRAPIAYFMSAFAALAFLLLAGFVWRALADRPYPDYEDRPASDPPG